MSNSNGDAGLVLPPHVAQEQEQEAAQDQALFVTVPAPDGAQLMLLMASGGVMTIPILAFSLLVLPNGQANGQYIPVPATSARPEEEVIRQAVVYKGGQSIDALSGDVFPTAKAWQQTVMRAYQQAQQEQPPNEHTH